MTIATDMTSVLGLVRSYYPAGVEAYDERYRQTEEWRRLRSLVAGVARDMGDVTEHAAQQPPVPDDVLSLGATVRELRAWPDFVQRLKERFNDTIIWDTTIPFQDPCYSCHVSLPGCRVGGSNYQAIVCLLSLLAPVYALYACRDRAQLSDDENEIVFPPLPEAFRTREHEVASLIEAEFGFVRLPTDVLLAPIRDRVPDADHLRVGQAQVIDFLFSPHRPGM